MSPYYCGLGMQLERPSSLGMNWCVLESVTVISDAKLDQNIWGALIMIQP
jgi:hypothetical protein